MQVHSLTSSPGVKLLWHRGQWLEPLPKTGAETQRWHLQVSSYRITEKFSWMNLQYWKKSASNKTQLWALGLFWETYAYAQVKVLFICLTNRNYCKQKACCVNYSWNIWRSGVSLAVFYCRILKMLALWTCVNAMEQRYPTMKREVTNSQTERFNNLSQTQSKKCTTTGC